MKIALVCESGGHLTEMLFLLEAVERYEFFIITEDTKRTQQLPFRKYLIKRWRSKSPLAPYFYTLSPILLIEIVKILKKERPHVLISTGGWISIPVFIIGKLVFGAKLIYITSWTRVNSKSYSGRILYYLSDMFLVQWESMVNIYGKKAKYVGGVI